jgi:hypothetical protein
MSGKELIPEKHGVYAWYFKTVGNLFGKDDEVHFEIKNCFVYCENTLLYVGIAPRNDKSKSNLRERIINFHYNGNCESSTLRFSIASLLSKRNNWILKMNKNRKRFLINDTDGRKDENWLSQWMGENAFVSFWDIEHPWEIESVIFEHFVLPLNIKKNNRPFVQRLKEIRKSCLTS